MKKIILVCIPLFAIALTTLVNINSEKNNLLSSITLDNIEALASSESGVNIACSDVCDNNPSYTCRIMYNGTFVKDCLKMKAK